MTETAFDYLSENKYATFSSNEAKWINRMKSLADSHPDEVKILYQPEDNEGYMLAHIPKSWVKCSPPHKRNLTDEQRAELAERLAKVRMKKG